MLPCLMLAGLLVSVANGLQLAKGPSYDPIRDDEKILRAAGLDTEGPALVAFLRAQALTDAQERELRGLIGQLGSAQYRVRAQAAHDIAATGSPVLPLLRSALKSADPEVRRRAQLVIEETEPQLEKRTRCILPVIRLLGALSPPGSAEALLGYLPYCPDECTEDAVYRSLASVTPPNAELEPCVRKGLDDPNPARRAAAGFVVGRSRHPPTRDLALPLLQDDDPRVRLRAAHGLVLGKDARGVPTLISLLADSSSAIRGQAEELLFGIAGDHAPRLCLADGTVAACRRYSEQWKTWWQTNGDVIDWNHLVLEQSWLTEPLVVEMDSNKVWALGPNAHPRWEIRGLHGPMDAQLLPNGRVLVAEYQGRRVTERDRSGNIYWSKEIDGSPVACRRLPNGNTFVATHTTLTEFGPDGRTLYLRYPGEGLFLFYAQRLTNGRIVFIANPGIIREIDTASGNELKTIRLGSEFGGWCGVETLNGGHYLVAFLNSGKVLEVDAAGKTVWECLIPGACHATRLADGSTVVANTTGMRLVTVDRSGRLRQEIRTEGRPWRVHARP